MSRIAVQQRDELAAPRDAEFGVGGALVWPAAMMRISRSRGVSVGLVEMVSSGVRKPSHLPSSAAASSA